MYSVAVKRDFVAQHYLTVSDSGPEGEKHSHHYQVELQLEGEELDVNNYLVDILDIEKALDGLVGRYRDQTLNELPEFAGVNPSLERFSRLLCQALAAHIQAKNIRAVTVKLWENDIAWAAFRQVKSFDR